MEQLTYDKFLAALVVILLIAGAYNTIMQTSPVGSASLC